MAKTIKEKIAALFPEIKQALETTGEEVSIEGVIVSLIFLIGIFLGVIFINNANETHKNEIHNYIKL